MSKSMLPGTALLSISRGHIALVAAAIVAALMALASSLTETLAYAAISVAIVMLASRLWRSGWVAVTPRTVVVSSGTAFEVYLHEDVAGIELDSDSATLTLRTRAGVRALRHFTATQAAVRVVNDSLGTLAGLAPLPQPPRRAGGDGMAYRGDDRVAAGARWAPGAVESWTLRLRTSPWFGGLVPSSLVVRDGSEIEITRPDLGAQIYSRGAIALVPLGGSRSPVLLVAQGAETVYVVSARARRVLEAGTGHPSDSDPRPPTGAETPAQDTTAHRSESDKG